MPKHASPHRQRLSLSKRTALAIGLTVLISLACSIAAPGAGPETGQRSAAAAATATRTPRPTFTLPAATAPAGQTANLQPTATNTPRPTFTPAATAPAGVAVVDVAASPTAGGGATQGGGASPGPTPTPTRPGQQSPPSTRPATTTATPLPSPTLPVNQEPTPVLVDESTPAAGPQPTPTSGPRPSNPTPTAQRPAWTFIGINASIDEDSVFIVGELVNTTGSPRKEVSVLGRFYNKQGKVINDQVDLVSYLPVEVIPVGGHVPFELAADSLQPVFRFELFATSKKATAPPRQDFEFIGPAQHVDEAGLYCVGGQIKNQGGPLKEFLVIMVVLYDGEGRVVSFGEYSVPSPEVVTGEQTSPFEICIDPLEQDVARYALRALGR